MYYREFLVPDDIERLLPHVEPEDKRRLLIIGAMRSAGVIERVHTTHLNLGLTVFRWMCVVEQDRELVRDLIREWLLALYGISEVTFHQDQREQRISEPDRLYFHCRGVHRK